LNTKCTRYLLDAIERRVARKALDMSNESPVQPSLRTQKFLRPLSIPTHPNDVDGKRLSSGFR
jgi:hypothetical protein